MNTLSVHRSTRSASIHDLSRAWLRLSQRRQLICTGPVSPLESRLVKYHPRPPQRDQTLHFPISLLVCLHLSCMYLSQHYAESSLCTPSVLGSRLKFTDSRAERGRGLRNRCAFHRSMDTGPPRKTGKKHTSSDGEIQDTS